MPLSTPTLTSLLLLLHPSTTILTLARPNGAPTCLTTDIRRMASSTPVADDLSIGVSLTASAPNYYPNQPLTLSLKAADFRQTINGVLLYCQPTNASDSSEATRIGTWTVTSGYRHAPCQCEHDRSRKDCGITHNGDEEKKVNETEFEVKFEKEYGNIVCRAAVAKGPESVLVTNEVTITSSAVPGATGTTGTTGATGVTDTMGKAAARPYKNNPKAAVKAANAGKPEKCNCRVVKKCKVRPGASDTSPLTAAGAGTSPYNNGTSIATNGTDSSLATGTNGTSVSGSGDSSRTPTGNSTNGTSVSGSGDSSRSPSVSADDIIVPSSNATTAEEGKNSTSALKKLSKNSAKGNGVSGAVLMLSAAVLGLAVLV